MRQWMVAASAAMLMAAGSAGAVDRMDGAAAAPVDLRIAEDVRNGDGRFSGIDYATSDRFRRAWLVLHYRSQGPCHDSDGQCETDAPVQVNVPGLNYDPAAKQVVYERAGAEPVICANVRSGGFPWFRESLTATGKCDYRVVKVDHLLDDGFAGRRDRREEVHFTIQGR